MGVDDVWGSGIGRVCEGMDQGYNPLDDLSMCTKANLSSAAPSHYIRVSGTPPPNLTNQQEVVSPMAPLGLNSSNVQQQQQPQQHAAAASSAEGLQRIQAEGSAVFRSLAQVNPSCGHVVTTGGATENGARAAGGLYSSGPECARRWAGAKV